MRIPDLLSMAFMNLWRRKFRAALTVLGMVIGTASIVVMISLGIGNSEAQREMFESWGSLTTITVDSYRWIENENGTGGTGVEVTLDAKAVESFRAIEGVEAVMPVVQSWGMIKSGKYVTDISLMGVTPEDAELFGFTLSEGRYPNSGSVNNIEVVFGSYVLQNFYNPKNYKQAIDSMGNPLVSLDSRFQLTFDYNNIYDSNQNVLPGEEGIIEQQPKGRMYKLTPVGVMDQNNNNSWYSLIDINTLYKLAKENKDFMGLDTSRYSQVWVKCESTDDVLAIKETIEEMGYGASTLMDGLSMMQESSKQTQMLLGGIGGVSLLVAAIGIMNTMMMSIYERTKEIGIIKVLGCRMSNIAGMFLTEAAYIGLFGGALGVGLSYGLSALLNMLFSGGGMDMSGTGAGMMSVIPVWLALFAMIFSIAVAVLSGMYPAWRAMRLSALSAIRSE